MRFLKCYPFGEVPVEQSLVYLLMRAAYSSHWIIDREGMQKEKRGDMYFRHAKHVT